MRVLLLHTEYKQQGGEDIVFIQERELLKNNGFIVDTILFNNKRYTFIKFFLLLFNPFSFFKVLRKIKQFKPDVIHVHNWYFGASPSIFIAAHFKKIRVVHTIHNFRILCPSAVIFYKNKLYFDSVKKYFPLRSVLFRVYKNSFFITGWVLLCTRFHYFLNTWNNIDKIICLTGSAKMLLCESYLKIPDEKIMVKPHFIPTFSESTSLKRKDHFLYVGRLSEEKGIDLLLRAFENSNHKLKIIGKGPMKDLVEKFALNNSNIDFLNFKNSAEIRKEMLDCSAVIFPSICYEQFGLVIVEAFATATAVISCDIGSPKELVKNGYNGFKFTTGNQKELVKKIELWQSSSENFKSMISKNALDTYLNNYQSRRSLTMLEYLYRSE